jgi:hypothetical protein
VTSSIVPFVVGCSEGGWGIGVRRSGDLLYTQRIPVFESGGRGPFSSSDRTKRITEVSMDGSELDADPDLVVVCRDDADPGDPGGDPGGDPCGDPGDPEASFAVVTLDDATAAAADQVAAWVDLLLLSPAVTAHGRKGPGGLLDPDVVARAILDAAPPSEARTALRRALLGRMSPKRRALMLVLLRRPRLPKGVLTSPWWWTAARLAWRAKVWESVVRQIARSDAIPFLLNKL